jgi:hypothetical protein
MGDIPGWIGGRSRNPTNEVGPNFFHKTCEIAVEKPRNRRDNLIKLQAFLSGAYF